MIYQLKITLKEGKPPIWRRIEIRDTASFYDLHKVIQIAFHWYNSHLHAFSIRKSNSVLMDDYYSIGPKLEEEKAFTPYKYNERDLQLKDILIKEKDRIFYTYDFGDDWEHEVLLEKISEEKEGVYYPRCTKVMRDVPEENSRYIYLQTGIITDEVDSKQVMADINEELEEEFTGRSVQSMFDEDDVFHIREDTHNGSTWEELIDLAEEYKNLAPWKWIDDDQIVVIQDPVTRENMYCSVLGGADIEYGLSIFIGQEGYHYLMNLFNEQIKDKHDFLRLRGISLYFTDRNELEEFDVDLLKQYGRTYRGKKQWIQFRSFKPGYFPWLLDEEEARLLSVVLRQLIPIVTSAYEDSTLLEPGTVNYFSASIDEETKTETLEESSLLVNELELQQLKHQYKKFNAPVEFGCEYIFFPTQIQPSDRPFYPKLILGLDRRKQIIVYHYLTGDPTEDLASILQQSVVELVKQLNGIPRELWITEETENFIKPVAKKLNINLLVVEQLPLFENAREEMERMMAH